MKTRNYVGEEGSLQFKWKKHLIYLLISIRHKNSCYNQGPNYPEINPERCLFVFPGTLCTWAIQRWKMLPGSSSSFLLGQGHSGRLMISSHSSPPTRSRKDPEEGPPLSDTARESLPTSVSFWWPQPRHSQLHRSSGTVDLALGCHGLPKMGYNYREKRMLLVCHHAANISCYITHNLSLTQWVLSGIVAYCSQLWPLGRIPIPLFSPPDRQSFPFQALLCLHHAQEINSCPLHVSTSGLDWPLPSNNSALCPLSLPLQWRKQRSKQSVSRISQLFSLLSSTYVFFFFFWGL